MSNDIYYLNRIIKIISPFTFQTFKIELNGKESELRDLLATILEINPNSIKGIRDSYNNYYTLSSAVKNPHLNTNPYNYYTVVIQELNNMNNDKNHQQIKTPSYNYNLLKNERIYTIPNENNINYHTNFLNNTYNFYEDNNNYNEGNINLNNYSYNNNIGNKKSINDFLNFADDLYKKNYIDNNLIKKLKKLILENNKEVLSIMSPYINLKSRTSYDEFAKKIIPIISYRSQLSENLNDSKYNIMSSEKDQKSNKKLNISQNEKIFDDIKENMSKKEYSKLKKLLKSKNKNLIKIINHFKKNKDFNKLISKLKKLVKEESNNSSEISENKTNNKKNKKEKNELKEKEIKKIDKNIINSLKDKGIDIYYISKYDLQKLTTEEKISLYKKKFKLQLDTLKEKDYKIPKKNISTIKNYYTEYINKKIKKGFDENENIIYEGLLEQEEENNFILKYYKDLLKHKNINELKYQIKQIIKETVERIQEEEGEEEEEDDEDGGNSSVKEEKNNEGKTLIKEEKEEEEEEEDEEEGEEEEDEKESKNEDNKSSSNKSSDNIIILKDDNKDRGVNLLNNNYRKINNYNYNTNKNDDEENNKEENDTKKNDEKNLGLGFVVVKPKNKKSSNGEENILKLNTTDSKQNESSVSTSQNKKLNHFIQQIEHLKKIDDIKDTIIQAINNNNKYIMDLFQKFQKNKFCLNPKSLTAVYKQIKENPDSNNQENKENKENKNNRSSQGNEFKSLINEIPNVNETTQAFLFDEFMNKKNSELEAHFSIYEENKEKDEFIESIQMFLNKSNTKKLISKFNLNHIKKEIEPKLSTKNQNLVEKSMEIIKIFEKNNLFCEKEFSIIKNSLENGDNIFTSTFQFLFDDKDFDEFYETISIALKNQMNKNKNNN